jgi:protein-tyrosine phosphatase
MIKQEKTKVLFVCMGNICRSPTAEGVFYRMVKEAGLTHEVEIDSAGTHAYHVGASPDARAQQAAKGRGYDLSGFIGRQVADQDFARFDYILAMDQENLGNLLKRCPKDQREKVRLFLEFSQQFTGQEVPDPYYGGPQGFDKVLDMVEDAARGLLEDIRRRAA